MDYLDNPILTKPASVALSPQPKASLPISEQHAHALDSVARTDPEDVVQILAPILALVGAAGMSQDDRREWLTAATDALKHIPHDLLTSAASRARLSCDHPSKVIPAIIRDVESAMAFRHRRLAELEERHRRHHALPSPGQSFCTAEEAREIVDTVFPQAREAAPQKTAHVPTATDYIALGHSPEAAAKIMDQYHRADMRPIGNRVSKATEWAA